MIDWCLSVYFFRYQSFLELVIIFNLGFRFQVLQKIFFVLSSGDRVFKDTLDLFVFIMFGFYFNILLRIEILGYEK